MKRQRDTKYLRWVASLPCIACGTMECQAHHVRMGHGGGLSRKPDDRYAIPLCFHDHDDLHRHGERRFFEARGIDPLVAAAKIYARYQAQRGAA